MTFAQRCGVEASQAITTSDALVADAGKQHLGYKYFQTSLVVKINGSPQPGVPSNPQQPYRFREPNNAKMVEVERGGSEYDGEGEMSHGIAQG